MTINTVVLNIKEGVLNSAFGIFQINLPDLSSDERSIVLGQLIKDKYHAVCIETLIICNK